MISEFVTTCQVENKIFDAPEQRKVFDVERMAYLISSYESASFFQKNMRMARNLITAEALLKFALSERTLNGLIFEFGVATGTTLRIICNAVNDTVFGFDTFEGLPEDWTHFQKFGRFSFQGQPPENLPENAQLVTGLFEQSLPEFLITNYERTVSFVHIDSDLYSSAKCILDTLSVRFRAGTIIVFDEYFNYPGWVYHEHKAFSEYLETADLEAEYIGFASSAQSVAVRLVAKNDAK